MSVKELITMLLEQDMDAAVMVHIEADTADMEKRVKAAIENNSELCLCDDPEIKDISLLSSKRYVYLTADKLKY